jgi:hypothetical protein
MLISEKKYTAQEDRDNETHFVMVMVPVHQKYIKRAGRVAQVISACLANIKH